MIAKKGPMASPGAVAVALLSGCGDNSGEQISGAAADPERQSSLPNTSLQPVITAPEQGGGMIPPGAVIGSTGSRGEGTAITFHSREGSDRLAAWYRSAERPDFRIVSELQEGAEQVLTGSLRRTPGAFTVRIAPGIKGGATATLIFAGP